MRLFITNIILFLLLHAAVFAQTPRAEWTEGVADSSGHALHTLVLHNVSKGSRVWFQELFDGRTYIEGPAIHIGGDEVPAGAWSGHDRKSLKEQFINGMLDLAEERGIKLAGWEDIARNLTPETQDRLRKSLYFLNVWNTKGIEGFPVVVSPADHTYLDLAYNDSSFEIGLNWAGYVDERKTFSLQPKEYLGDIVGVEAALWSSQLRSFSDATYQMLPKGLGTAERAWNAYPNWPNEDAFKADFERFYGIIMAREWPVWKEKGYKSEMRR